MQADKVHPQALALAFREQSRASIGFDIFHRGVPKPEAAHAGTDNFSVPSGNSHSVA